MLIFRILKYWLFVSISFLIILPLPCHCQKLIIDSLTFVGNDHIESTKLEQALELKSRDEFSYEKLNKNIENLLELYKNSGYYSTKIESPQVTPSNNKNAVNIKITIVEGERLKVGKVSFSGNKYFSGDKLKSAIKTKTDAIFSPEILNNDLEIISYMYAKKGYPFCRIEIEKLEVSGAEISISINVEENKIMRISNLAFEGNKITKNKTLKLILNFRENEIYDQKKVEQAKQNLLKKKYITSAQIVPLNTKNLLIKIQEKSMNNFRGVLGLSPDEDKSFRERLTGFIDFDFMNIFGTDREVKLLWEKFKNSSYKMNLSYKEPFLFNTQTSAMLSLKRKNVDTIFVRTDAEIGINYILPDYNQIGISYLSSNSLLDTVSTDRNGLGMNLTYDTLENEINPQKGYSIIGQYSIIWRSKSSYRQELQTNLNYILPFSQKTNFYFGLSNNFIFTHNDSLSTYDLFEFGGYENLRGFANNQFRSKQYSVITCEYRYLLSTNSRIFTFTDYCLSDNYDPLLGVGVGFRFMTKIGLLKTDYGIGYQNGKWTNPLEGTIHFGLETGF